VWKLIGSHLERNCVVGKRLLAPQELVEDDPGDVCSGLSHWRQPGLPGLVTTAPGSLTSAARSCGGPVGDSIRLLAAAAAASTQAMRLVGACRAGSRR
jgi:hypothetical protein